MKHFFAAAAVFVALLATPATSRATIDGGTTATVLGIARDGQLAVILEHDLQEDCDHVPCVVYATKTSGRDFVRQWLVTLPPRIDELRKQVCADLEEADLGEADLREAECAGRVNGILREDDGVGDETEHVLDRYRNALSPWQRALLGKVEPATPLPMPEGDLPPSPSPLIIDELGSPPLRIVLRERWKVPSFRAYSDDEQPCSPDRVSGCTQQVRWEDGAPSQKWVCPTRPATPPPTAPPADAPPADAPPADAAPPNVKAPLLDCGGHASMIRVEASWGDGPASLGRSTVVEPGNLIQAHRGMMRDRTVPLSSLQMVRHALQVVQLPHAVLVVGAFAHEPFGNGTWFPLVVAVQRPPR